MLEPARCHKTVGKAHRTFHDLLFGLMWQKEMANYRRAREGHTYFFTVVTYRRQAILCLDESRSILREAIIKVRERYPFTVEAWVLLPEHLHCIWQLPEGDKDYSVRWALIKKEFTKKAKHHVDVIEPTSTQQKRGEGTIWQRRFW